MITLHVNKLVSTAILPKKAHISNIFEDAAFDLFSDHQTSDSLVIQPNSRILVPTGIRVIIPSGYWVKFHDRSGNATKYGVHVLGGIIDNTYTGEWKVILQNSSDDLVILDSSKAIAQFTIEKLTPCIISETSYTFFESYIDSRTRKENGFGSTDETTK